MAKKIGTKEIEEMFTKLSLLYKKARTIEDYRKEVELREEYANTLEASSVTLDTIILTILPGYWAEYYLLMKFPTEVGREGRYDFMEQINMLKLQAKDFSVKAELLYLESVAWSHLMGDQNTANLCNNEFRKLVSENKVPVTLILKGINSRAIKEMDAKELAGCDRNR